MRIPVITGVVRRCGNGVARWQMRGRPAAAGAIAEARATQLRARGDLVAAESWFSRAAWRHPFRSAEQNRLRNEAARCALGLAQQALDPVARMEWLESAVRTVEDRQLAVTTFSELAEAKAVVARALCETQGDRRALRRLVRGDCPAWMYSVLLRRMSEGAVAAADRAAQLRAELIVAGAQTVACMMPPVRTDDIVALAAQCCTLSDTFALIARAEDAAAA